MLIREQYGEGRQNGRREVALVADGNEARFGTCGKLNRQAEETITVHCSGRRRPAKLVRDRKNPPVLCAWGNFKRQPSGKHPICSQFPPTVRVNTAFMV